MTVNGLSTMKANANRQPENKAKNLSVNERYERRLIFYEPLMNAKTRPPINRHIKLMNSAFFSPNPSRSLSEIETVFNKKNARSMLHLCH